MSLPSGPAALADRPDPELASELAHEEDLACADPAWRRWADVLPDICLWLDPHSGRVIDCNRALFGALGFSRTEVRGWPLQAFAEPRHLELAADTWRQLAQGAGLATPTARCAPATASNWR